MSFARYMIGFLLVMAVLVWAAVVAGVPQQYLAIGVLVLLVAGIAAAVLGVRGNRYPPNRRIRD